MRYLEIVEPLVFEMIYDGIEVSPRGYNYKETRVISKVQDKLELLGEKTKREGRDTYKMRDNGVINIILEDTEYTLVLEALQAIRWTGSHTRAASRMFNLLENAPSKSPLSDIIKLVEEAEVKSDK